VSVVANVAINVDSSGAVSKLRQVQQGAQATSQAVDKLNATNDALAASFTKSGKPIQTAANGMRFFTDATGRARKENGQFVTTAEAAAAGLQKQGRAAQQAGSSVSSLGGTIRNLIGAYAAIQAVKFVFTQAAELESQSRSLAILAGSAEKANKIIKELQDLGAVTPFTSTELIDSAKRLQAFGVEADKVVETTRRLADVSGATGAELSGLVTAYGQVQAKGRLQGEELLQFQERGVALQTELRKMYGLSGDEFQKALEKGRIGAEAVQVAIINLTNAGGKYANGAIAQSDTLNGKLSTLQDSFQQLARNIGTFFEPVFKFLIDGINAFLDRVNNGLRVSAQLQANEQAAVRTRNKFGAFRAANPFDQEAQAYEARLRQSLLKATPTAGRGGGPSAPSAPGVPALLSDRTGGKGRKKGKTDAERAAERAEKEAKRLAEQIAQQKSAAAELLAIETGRLMVATTAEPLQQKITAAIVRQADIQREYNEKLKESKSAEETLNLQLAQRNAIGVNALELQQALTQEVDSLTEPLQSILNESKARLELENRYQKLLADGVNPELAKEFAQLELTAEKQTQLLTLRLGELEAAKAKLSAESAVALALQDQIDKIKEILKLQGQAVDNSKQETEEEKKKREQREKEKQKANELKDLYKGIGDTVEDGIVASLSAGIDALLNGTKDLDDALKDIAKGVLQEIANMLIKFAVRQAFAAFAGGAADGATFANGVAKFASGGIVGSPTLFQFADGGTTKTGLMGEAGPEAIMPLKRGADGKLGVAANLDGAMSRYRRLPGAAGGGGEGGDTEGGTATAAAGPMVVDVRYSVERINSVEYVTASQFQAGMQQAAQQGATQGEQRTLRKLQMSSSTRRRIGV
jgi:tape measure domain-containing protein